MGIRHWQALGDTSPGQLGEARLLLHHAAQLVAAVGRSLLPPQADDGHTSLEWVSSSAFLAGQEVTGRRSWRLALCPGDLSLGIASDGSEAGRLSLEGHTVGGALEWIVAQAADLGSASERLTLERPYAIPDHPVGSGAAFSIPGGRSLDELARWYANADALLREMADGWPGAAPVRVWPHHFDIGSILPLGGGRGDAPASLGIGLSPGDQGIAEPYLYVTPWPPPPTESLPGLPSGGHWHREGWTGVVLTGSEIVANRGAAQASLVRAFLGDTVDALRAAHDPHR